jgi:vacuolar-type H+-ATPase subunit F/Vma7
MNDRLRVLSSPAAAAGFRLAGLAPVEAGDPAEGARRLLVLLDDGDAGVVLVEQTFYDALSEPARRALARRALPMIVPFPAPSWTPPDAGPAAFITELLRQAIGYRVRLA